MDSVNGCEENLHNALNKSGRHFFPPSPPVVFRLVIESTFSRIAGAFGKEGGWGGGGVRIRDRLLFVFGVVGSGHTRRLYI